MQYSLIEPKCYFKHLNIACRYSLRTNRGVNSKGFLMLLIRETDTTFCFHHLNYLIGRKGANDVS